MYYKKQLEQCLSAFDAGLPVLLVVQDFNGEIISERQATSREEIVSYFESCINHYSSVV